MPLSHKGRGELVLFNVVEILTICKIRKYFIELQSAPPPLMGEGWGEGV
jgi:hypothetical protein